MSDDTIEWKRTGPRQATIEDLLVTIDDDERSWNVYSKVRCLSVTGQSSRPAVDAPRAAALVSELLGRGAWAISHWAPEPEINMAHPETNRCELCDRFVSSGECFHPARQVREAVSLLVRARPGSTR